MKVGFYVRRIDKNIASVLYRCLYPASRLAQSGYATFVFESRPSARKLRALDAIVIVKATSQQAYLTALEAKAQGVPIILDICDDIFVPGYGKGDGADAQVFRAMAALASAVVTTGPAMVQLLQREIGHNAKIVVLEDPIETAEDNALVADAIKRWSRHTLLENSAAKGVEMFASIIRMARKAKSLTPRRWLGTLSNLVRSSPSPASAQSEPHAAKAKILPSNEETYARCEEVRKGVSTSGRSLHFELDLERQQRTIIWFGNAGASYGDFGLQNLRIVFPALRAVAQEIPLKLVCVSDNRKKFEEIVHDCGVECEFVQWTREECMRRIEAADVFIAPNSLDRFSKVKSANRLALSLSLGTPVVATLTPAAACLAPYVIFDDWYAGIRTYLTDSERVSDDVERGRAFVVEAFSSAHLAKRWEELLAETTSQAPEKISKFEVSPIS